MIDAGLLRQLGWSEDLIRSVSEAAEPLRGTPGTEIALPEMSVHSTATSAVYAEVVVNHTAKNFTVQVAPEEQKRTA